MVEKAKINGKILDVISLDQYRENPDIYNNSYTAIKDNGIIYPIRTKQDFRPGIYPSESFIFYKQPQNEEEKEEYSENKTINFSDAKSLKEVIEKQDSLNKSERTILTTINNVYSASINPNDTPHMKALKEAINSKNIDLDQYEQRFGANYNNDRRLIDKKNDITMPKLRSFLDKLDLTATLTISDKSPDVPNPMGKTITVELVSQDMEEE